MMSVVNRRLFLHITATFSLVLIGLNSCDSFAFNRPTRLLPHCQSSTTTTTTRVNEKKISSYEETDGASKGLVSSLTGIINTVTQQQQQQKSNNGKNGGTSNLKNNKERDLPPKGPQELCNRIRDDYVVNNYLWTGNLDFACFESTCRFTDPTLSFEGTDTFRTNTQNLVPLVEAFVDNPQSILLDIRLGNDNDNDNDNDNNFVETRWNMKGELNGLFWKPKIDVIGRTKFWFRKESNLVYFYDEKWEMPAYKALLQLVTPGRATKA